MAVESWTITDRQIIDLAAVHTLDAHLLSGRIDVVAHEDPRRTDARLEIHSVSGRPVTVRLDGGTLHLGYDTVANGWKSLFGHLARSARRDTAHVHIAIPASTRTRISTAHSDGFVAGMTAGIHISTVSGSIMLLNTGGALRLDTVSGDVAVCDHDGIITMDTVSGTLTATGTVRELVLNTVSGAVTLDSRVTPTHTRITAVSADILIRVPDPETITYDLDRVTGILLIDGIEYRQVGAIRRMPEARPGAPRLRVSTVSGNVAVLRTATGNTAAPPANDPDHVSGPGPSAAKADR